MASYDDPDPPITPPAPLVPGQAAAPPVDSAAQTGGLADQWRSWMNDPHNRAAMIQFGVSLSQPIAAGQNALGQIGSAVGQAGEASDRITAEQQKEEELAQKGELRSAQAQLAGSKAETAGTVAAARQQALEFKQQQLAMQGNIAGLRALTALQNTFQKEHAKWASDKGLGIPTGPEPTWDSVLSKNPDLAAQLKSVQGGVPAQGGGGGGDLLSQARDAISRGANRAAVIERLRQQGVDPSGL